MAEEESHGIVCLKCGYDRNPETAKACQICGIALKKTVSLPLLVSIALLILMGVSALLTQQLFRGTRLSQTKIISGAKKTGFTARSTTTLNVQPAKISIYSRLAEVPNVPEGEFRYGGSTTFAPLRSLAVTSNFSQTFPNFNLRYVDSPTGNPGSRTGIAQLIDGDLSFAESSRPLKPAEIERANAKKLPLEAVPIALDSIAIFVNPDLVKQGIEGLTIAQLRNIFTGKIKNWQELGGPDLEITAISREPSTGGTPNFFLENVLDQKPFTSNLIVAQNTTDEIRKVAAIPGGISYASSVESFNQKTIQILPIGREKDQLFVTPCGNDSCSQLNPEVLRNGTYPILRRLFVIIKRDGSKEEQAGIAYASLFLSDEGQTLVSNAGFVPIR